MVHPWIVLFAPIIEGRESVRVSNGAEAILFLDVWTTVLTNDHIIADIRRRDNWTFLDMWRRTHSCWLTKITCQDNLKDWVMLFLQRKRYEKFPSYTALQTYHVKRFRTTQMNHFLQQHRQRSWRWEQWKRLEWSLEQHLQPPLLLSKVKLFAKREMIND